LSFNRSSTFEDVYGEFLKDPKLLARLAAKKNHKALDLIALQNSSSLVKGVPQITNFAGLKAVADGGCAVSQHQFAMGQLTRSEFALYKKVP
jgi:hypothetical protein